MHEASLSLIVCLSDEATLKANLLASPCLGPGSPHEVIAVRNAPSAAAGLTLGWARARNDLIVCVHQDVVLPAGWDRLVVDQYQRAERRWGPIGVAGVYGVGEVVESPGQPPAARRIGRVVDRGRLLRDGPELPAAAVTLDELLLILRRDGPLRAEPALGFHLYGADLCLQARERGLAVVVLDALCHHNSRSLALPAAFSASAEVFARKWAHRLPVATPCAVFDRDERVFVLGNAEPETSVAAAVGRPLLGRETELPMHAGGSCNHR
ncbi:MAG TPA: glycosyltransferase [Isosphaeraceae bacterium]|nr:glycosyltransferase [Isosphaeraceae bacterium]